MKQTTQETVEKTTIICDLCKKKSTRRTCVGCGIDLCSDCGVWWETDPWSETDLGDYWDRVCPECNEKAQPILEEVEKIHRESEEKIDVLKRRWKESCAR